MHCVTWIHQMHLRFQEHVDELYTHATQGLIVGQKCRPGVDQVRLGFIKCTCDFQKNLMNCICHTRTNCWTEVQTRFRPGVDHAADQAKDQAGAWSLAWSTARYTPSLHLVYTWSAPFVHQLVLMRHAHTICT